MATEPRPAMHVEGKDDLYSLVHLLGLNGLDYDTKPWPAAYPKFYPKGSDNQLLESMSTAIKAGTEHPIGFVIDANSSLEERWKQICTRLNAADVEAPTSPVLDGFIGDSSTYKTRVGIWIMPDNEHDGNLENFLHTLIADDDQLIHHATQATDEARVLGALFSDSSRVKAIIRTWLAWQKDPGMPYGRAIQNHYFQPESDIVCKFVAWFKKLYCIDLGT